jgi:hypothetical protein
MTREDIINNTFISFDHNTERDLYISKVYEEADPNIDNDTDSIKAFGFQPESPEEINFKGLNKLATINSTNDYSARDLFCRAFAVYLFNRFALNTKIFELEILASVGKNISLGEIVLIERTKLIQWKGDGKGTRGLPESSTDQYGIVDNSYWGEYTAAYVSNLFLSDYQTGEGVENKELITLKFFKDLLQNYNNDSSFMNQHNRA